MSANFDAQLNLDISKFLSAIKTAKSQVDELVAHVQAANAKLVISPTIKPGAQPRPAPGVNPGPAPTNPMDEARYQPDRQTGDEVVQNAARMRYALYDVASSYAAISAAAIGSVTAVVKTAADYESAFTGVERTTEFTSIKVGEAASVMRYELTNLATEIPLAFSKITEIATIGNQLGIAQGALEGFTETVAKFSATTDVTAQNAAMSFGRIGQLLDVSAQDYEKLGSSIAYVGVKSVATESQILTTTKEIATAGKIAGFTASETVGLASALASLGIAPEAARGSIIRLFTAISKGSANGGAQLENFAAVAGMSSEKFAQTWETNAQGAFDALLQGLNAGSDSAGEFYNTLDALGVKNVRDVQLLQKLSAEYGTYAQSVSDANKGFEDGTFLSTAYGQVQDDVNSKLIMLNNTWSNLLDTIGQTEGVQAGVGFLIDAVTNLLNTITSLVRSPIGAFLVTLVTVLGSVVGAVAALNSVTALAKGSMLAFVTAQNFLIAGSKKAAASTATMNGELVTTEVVARKGASGLTGMAVAASALKNALKAIAWMAIAGVAIEALNSIGEAMKPLSQQAEEVLGGFGGLQEAILADTQAYKTALTEFGDTSKAEAVAGAFQVVSTEMAKNNEETNNAITSQNNLNLILGDTASNMSLVADETQKVNYVLGENTKLWLINAIRQSETFQELVKNKDAMEAIANSGVTMNGALQAAANGTLDEYFNTLTVQAASASTWFEQLYKWFGDLINSGSVLGVIFGTLGAGIQQIINFGAGLFGIDLFPVTNGMNALKAATGGAVAEAALLGPALQQANKATASTNAEKYAGQLDKVAKSASGAAKEIRTVVDYANDLDGVFNRIKDIKFGRQQAQDEIASGWADIAQKAKDAEQAVRDANAEIADIQADRSVLLAQIAVSERYGDTARVAIGRAKLAKLDADLAKKQEELAKAQDGASKSLDGNSEAAIDNRKTLLGMAGSYQGLIKALIETGLKGKPLQDRIKALKKDFLEQAEGLGFAKDELGDYTGLFDGFAEAAKKTPRNVTIEFDANVSAATQAVNEYIAKLDKASGTRTTKLEVVLPDTTKLKKIVDGETYRFLLRALERETISPEKFYKAVYGVDLQKRASGGLITGPGTSTSDSIPAMLSAGEYVIQASAVSAYGTDFMNALNQQRVGMGSLSSLTGGAGAGSSMVYLSPEDRALLRAAVDRPVTLYADNTKIAQSANAGNIVLAKRGVR